MRVKRRKTMALLAAVSIVCAQSTVSDVFAAGAEEVAAQENNAVSIEYLTLQPGERDDSVNLNWYAPEGTQNAIVRMGDKTVEASVRALHTPTKVVEGKYTDTGKIVCQATVSGLSKGTEYSYQISYDNGNTWSKKYSYETPNAGEFRFGFTSDPQIKENGETNNGGWNPSDGKNQTGWAVMLDKMKEEDVNLIVSAGDQVEDQSWGKSSEYAAFFAPEEMTSLLYAPAVGNHDRHYMFDDHFNLPNEMSVDGNAASLNQVKTTFRGQNSGTSQSHGNYIQATADEIAQSAESNGVTPNKDGQYDFVERREMETKGNYYYLYNNVLFVTLNTGAYPGGNDNENAGNVNVPSASKDNSEAEAIVSNFRTNPNFMNFIALGDKKKREKVSVYSDNYSSGLSTNRDVWVYNYSGDKAKENAERMISFYNSERERCHQRFNESVIQGICLSDAKTKATYIQNIRSNDKNKISWSRGLFNRLCKNEIIDANDDSRLVMYRPFCKKNLYYNSSIIEMPSRWKSIYPDKKTENLVICVSGAPIKKGFSVLMTDCIQDLNLLEHSLCMPLYIYDKVNDGYDNELTLFDFLEENIEYKPKYKKRYAISDSALKKFQERYGSRVDKESIFYYIYAVLQSKGYVKAYEDNLSKEMPRIPMLDKFMDYVEVGKELADLHVNYERCIDPAEIGLIIDAVKPDYTVSKMKFKKQGKSVCRDTIIYNEYITISNIPERAYEYVINGKSAIEWIVEKYAVTVEKVSGIVDDPNIYQSSKYIFDLLISVIGVSLKTQDLIDRLPEYKEI